MLGIAWGSFFAITAAWYVMPTLQPDLRELYGITASQFRLALTVPLLVAGALAIPGGVLADRFGVRRTTAIGIGIAGLGLLGRSRPGGFVALLLPMVLVGTGLGLIMPNLPKVVSVWFAPDETGLATGIYATGLLGGISTGLVVAPYLPGWTRGNLVLGGVVLLLMAAFYLAVPDLAPGEVVADGSPLEGLRRAVRSRNAWFAAFGVFGGSAGMVAIQGEFPAGLLAAYGISPVTGGQIASVITFSGLVGSLTIPAAATKLRRRRGMLVAVSVGFGVIELPVWLTGETTTLFVGSAVAGYLAGGALPMLLEVPTWLPRVEADPVEGHHVGGASGLLTSAMNLGGFVGLPLIVGPVIEGVGYTAGFAVAMVLFAFQGVAGLLLTFPAGGQ